MSKTWFTADQHFYHANILNFKDETGQFIRPEFNNVDEMNEYMIDQWNSVIKPDDKVYQLGDIVMKTGVIHFENIMLRLNGRKVLIRGNHDKAKLHVYAKYFTDVRSEIHLKTQEGDMVVFTHRPIVIPQNENYWIFNAHGHIHQKLMTDLKYINLCVEQWDYLPISWEQVQAQVHERKILLNSEV